MLQYRVTDGSGTVFKKKKKYSVDFQLEMDLFLQNERSRHAIRVGHSGMKNNVV